MRRSRFYVRFDARVPWPMLGVCAALGMLPLVVGWVTYQAAERVLDVVVGRQ